MRETKTGAEIAEDALTVFIEQVEARSISEDGRTCVIVALGLKEVASGKRERVALMFSTQALPALISVLADLNAESKRRDLPRGNILPRFPKSLMVGNSEQYRGMVITSFDPETPDETHMFMPNAMGLKLAKMLRTDILPRLTDAERIKAIADEARIDPAPGRRIILPPGHG